MDATVSSVASWIEPSWVSIDLVASEACWLRHLISPATTANPRPASPTRAASMAASRASRLVWSAIDLMTLEKPPEARRGLRHDHGCRLGPGRGLRGDVLGVEDEDELLECGLLALEQVDDRGQRGGDRLLGCAEGLLDVEEQFVEGLDLADGAPAWQAAVGVVADHGAVVVVAGGDVGEDPVVVAAPGLVDDIDEDLVARLDGVPEELEQAPGHGGVADDVVRLAEDSRLGVLGDAEEDTVGVGDPSLEVGLADDDLVPAEGPLDAGGSDGWRCLGFGSLRGARAACARSKGDRCVAYRGWRGRASGIPLHGRGADEAPREARARPRDRRAG